MAKKPAFTSKAGKVDIAEKMQQDLSPPSHVPLEKVDMPFWDSVLAEFARSQWTKHQLELAAMLARTMADLEKEQRLLRKEGSVTRSDRGTPVVNPRKVLIAMHSSTILNIRRSLQLHARATNGPAHAAARKTEGAKAVESALRNQFSDEDLIGRPN